MQIAYKFHVPTEHLNSLHGALAAIKHTAPPFYMNISAHGVGWWRQVYDSALHLGHHVYAVSYPLGANATVLQTLQSRENIRLETHVEQINLLAQIDGHSRLFQFHRNCDSKYLEGEMVRSTSRCRVDLNGSSLHCITDQDCLVDISCENTSLK